MTALKAVTVRLEVRTSNDEIVIAEESPLMTWTTSGSLVYKRGAERQESKAGGALENVRTDVHASQDWGTYFTPQGSTSYVVQFDVVEPKGASHCESRLVLLSGGWN